jgi:hypothetical protein
MTNTVSRILSDETINRIIQIESAGNPNAKAPTSSAAGLGQFITATWLATAQKHKPGLFKSAQRDQVAAMRVGAGTAALQLEMLARFTEDNRAALGENCTDGDLYLAHFLGAGAARLVLRADQSARVEPYVGTKAVEANRSILSGKTCAQVRAWAQASMEQRWEKAGRKDWVKKYANAPDLPPMPPDIEPMNPLTEKPKGNVAGTGAVVVAAGGGTVIANEAAKQGASTTQIAIVVGITLVVALAAFFVIRHFFKKG